VSETKQHHAAAERDAEADPDRERASLPTGTYTGMDVADLATIDLEERGHGDARVAATLRLIDEASRPRPLPEVLAAICAEISAILHADVVSLYLRERGEDGREDLRMAANVGFPAGAVSHVRLRVGEGITGFVAESLRPASVVLAPEHNRYKHFPELREERFPIFLAVPLLVGHRAEGVVVLQRARDAFGDDEILLATALTTTFVLAIERAEDHRTDVTPAEEPQAARLEGVPLAPGRAMGRVETLPTFEGLAAIERADEGNVADDTSPDAITRRRERITLALDGLVKDLASVRKRLGPQLPTEAAAGLETLALLETDGRLREALLDEGAKQNVALGIRKVARDYVQAVYKAKRSMPPTATSAADTRAWLVERSAEIEELCLVLAARLVGDRAPTGGSVLLVPDRLTAMMALAAAGQRTAAIAICHEVDLVRAGLGVAVARAAQIPTVGDVGGLFAWARRGDTVLVDGDAGVVRVHPSPAQIAQFRSGSRA
jgi:phosphotransferase system enzyme I (PtsP)